ncbi:MAG TPA: hypothetical protein VNB91_14735 [Jatrophihabitantaceae bacterium]|nr:hypothetical protein [Jatrophihabitantaceae bacterium]
MHYSSARVGGDDPELSPEQVQAWHRKVGAPDNELPGAIPFHAVLAKTDDLAVAVVGADAYSTGMSIKIAIRLRRSDPSRHGLDAPPYGPGGGTFLVGVAYPDGRTASNVSSHGFPDSVYARGGAVSHGSWRWRWWPHLRDGLLADAHATAR